MSSFNENRQLFESLQLGRRNISIREIDAPSIWIEDVRIEGTTEVVVEFNEKEDWLEVKNEFSEIKFGFILLDGNNGVFKSSPPVKNENQFKYPWTSFDKETGKQKVEEKTAGPCDCLILDKKWRFFEFKTNKDSGNASSNNPMQADLNRGKAAAQLSRTLTSFKEAALSKGLSFPLYSECILVTRPDFPFSVNAKDATSILDPLRFFILFKARLVEVKTNETYSLT